MIHSEILKIYEEKNIELIPQIFVDMLIIAEDHRYNRHKGVDFIAIIRACYKFVFLRKVEGGSTIAMQLARVITGKYERTAERKVKEMLAAYKITKTVHKSEIPRLYLSVAYFGHAMNGIGSVISKKGINIKTVTEYQAAEIIARLKYPEPRKYNKSRDTQIKNRALYILKRHKKYSMNLKLNVVSI